MTGFTGQDSIQIHFPLVPFAHCCGWVYLACLSWCFGWNNGGKNTNWKIL